MRWLVAEGHESRNNWKGTSGLARVPAGMLKAFGEKVEEGDGWGVR